MSMTTLQWADQVQRVVEGGETWRSHDFTEAPADADLWDKVAEALDLYGPFDFALFREDQAERLRRETGQRDTIYGVRVEVYPVSA